MCDGPEQRPRRAPGLRVFRCQEWEAVRQLRLRALATDRDLFVPLPGELSRDEAGWRSEVEDSPWVVATVDGAGVGLARVNHAEDGPHVEALWVDHGYRRAGIATRLLQELFRIEREHGVQQLFAWVVEGNSAARRLYDRLGFRRTDDRQPLTHGGHEVRYRIWL